MTIFYAHTLNLHLASCLSKLSYSPWWPGVMDNGWILFQQYKTSSQNLEIALCLCEWIQQELQNNISFKHETTQTLKPNIDSTFFIIHRYDNRNDWIGNSCHSRRVLSRVAWRKNYFVLYKLQKHKTGCSASQGI